MQMNLGRRLSEAVGSWLHLEFCCHRGGLMSEGALKGAVGHVLSAFPTTTAGARVHADLHPNALQTGLRGRKRCIDFAQALVDKSGKVLGLNIAIEAKWAGSSHCSSSNIGDDFIRLSLVKRKVPTARCFFLIAGTSANIATILGKSPFTDSAARNTGISIKESPRRLIFDPLKPYHRAGFQDAIKDWQKFSQVPRSIVTSAHGKYPEQNAKGTVRFQSIVWEITEVDVKNTAGNW